ncbi:MAG: hypothetical protein ACRDIV_02440 [Ktedonobacteraceae bacterium]
MADSSRDDYMVAGNLYDGPCILVVGILCYLFLLGKIEQIEAPFAVKAGLPGPHMEAPTESSPPRKAS